MQEVQSRPCFKSQPTSDPHKVLEPPEIPLNCRSAPSSSLRTWTVIAATVSQGEKRDKSSMMSLSASRYETLALPCIRAFVRKSGTEPRVEKGSCFSQARSAPLRIPDNSTAPPQAFHLILLGIVVPTVLHLLYSFSHLSAPVFLAEYLRDKRLPCSASTQTYLD